MMASSLRVNKVKLSENDVPGAALQENKALSGHTATELKRWLQCRGHSVSGNKTLLIERISTCIKNELTDISPAVDNGIWYKRKLTVNNNAEVGALPLDKIPDFFPVTNWKNFPSRRITDNYCYGIIYEHLIVPKALVSFNESSSDLDSDKENSEKSTIYNTAKPLKKGRQYFLSGHVQNIKDNLSTSGHYCLKADVTASFDGKVIHKTMVMLNKIDARVMDSSCDCKASALGRCSHVGGLLFTLEDFVVNFGNDPVSCTSTISRWNRGRQKKKTPGLVGSKSYGRKCRWDDMRRFKPSAEDDDPLKLLNHLQGEVYYYNEEHRLWPMVTDFHYLDYVLSAKRRYDLLQLVQQFQNALTINLQGPAEVPNTTGQPINDKWRTVRKLYVTASNAKLVANANADRYRQQLNDTLYNSTQLVNIYVQHGTKYEDIARELYTAAHPDRTVTTTGNKLRPLVLN